MKKLIIVSGISVVVILTFLFLEPILVYKFGWQSIPTDTFISIHSGVAARNYKNQIDSGQALLTTAHQQSGAPAISVAIGLNNRVIWSEARGYSDVETKSGATPETMFRIGSVSKAVTSAGLGWLLQSGKLELDKATGKYLTDFPHPEITIRQLASHTSGIRNYGWCFCFPGSEYHNNDAFISVPESIAFFADDELLFEPGSAFSYSSYNYTVLSGVIEQASNSPFPTFMQKHVFEPFKMDYTTVDQVNTSLPTRSKFYDIEGSKYKVAYPVDNSNKWAGGGLLSTPTDLVKLGNALLNYVLLDSVTVNTLFSAQKISTGEVNVQNYALGWRHDYFDLMDNQRSVEVVHHGGKAVGSTALLVLFPEYNLTIAMTMNKSAESFPMFDYAIPIAEHFIRSMPAPIH